MRVKKTKIVVTSGSFSKNETLKSTLLHHFSDVEFNPSSNGLTEQKVIQKLSTAEAAIIGLDPISDAVLKACPKLKFISKYGVGLDNIDQSACARSGVKIGWSGGINKRSVSEMTLGFMLSMCRNLYPSSILLKNGTWKKNGGYQLSGKTIGIIGIGNVGKDLISLLQPFKCTILVNDIIDQSEYYQAQGIHKKSKTDLFKEADIVTIHTPLTHETKYMINKKTLALMKPTSFIINTARGPIIDEKALQFSLEQKKIAGAALDVYEAEPPLNQDLINLPTLFCTPHIGGNAAEAVQAMGQSAISHLKNHFL